MFQRYSSEFFFNDTQLDTVVSDKQVDQSYQFDPWLFCASGGEGPAWVGSEPKAFKPRQKKIILSTFLMDFYLKDSGYSLDNLRNFIKDGFELYILDSSKKLVKLTLEMLNDSNELIKCFSEKLAGRRENILVELKAINENPDHFLVYDDYFASQQILNSKQAHAIYKLEYGSERDFLDKVIACQRIEEVDKFCYLQIDADTETLDLNRLTLPNVKTVELQHIQSTSILLPLNITRLSLKDNDNLVNVLNCESLKNLTYLKMEKCPHVTDLTVPENLEELDVSKCPQLSDIDLSKAHKLRILNLLNIGKLDQMLPEQLEELSITLSSLPSMDYVPKNLNLLWLKSDNRIDSLEFKEFPKLEKLTISSLTNLNAITSLPANIEFLTIEYCPNLTTLPDLSQFPNLKHVMIEGCPGLKDISVKEGVTTDINPGRKDVIEKLLLELKQTPKKLIIPSVKKTDFTPDSETYVDPETTHKVTCGIYQGPKQQLLPVELYRQHVQSEIDLKNNQYVLTSESKQWDPVDDVTELSDIQMKQQLAKMGKEDFYVDWKIPPTSTSSEIIMMLPMMDSKITHVPKGCKILKNPHTQEYKIILPKDFKPPLRYLGTRDTEYKPIATPVKPVPTEFFAEIEKCLSLLDSKFPNERMLKVWLKAIKLGKLNGPGLAMFIDFFQKYMTFDPTTSNAPLSDITKHLDQAFRVILEKKGACRHRAHAFVLLCQAVKIPARLVTNELHAYVEVYNQNKWIAYNLGGADTLVDSHQLKSPTLPKLTAVLPSPNPWSSYFSPEQVLPSDIKQTKDLIQWLTRQKNVLLRVNDFPTTRGVYEAIVKETKEAKLPVFYLESEADINDFLTLRSIEKDAIQSRPGPLAEFLEKGNGVLVINWQNFTPTQIASYKSLMDSNPTLKKHTVSPNLKIINLATLSNSNCTDFLSRTKHLDWPNHIQKPESVFIPPALDSEEKEVKGTITVEFYGEQHGFEKQIIGNIKMTEKGFQFIPGALNKAIRENKNLMFVDAPIDDPKFQAFLYRLQVQKQYIENGVIHHLEKVPTISFTQSKFNNEPPTNLENIDNESFKKQTHHEIFYLNQQNFQQLFENTIVDKDKLISRPGWFENNSDKPKTLVLTTTLSDTQKNKLYSRIAESSETIKILDLTTQPEVTTKSTYSPDAKEFKSGAYLFETEDPHFLAKEYKESADLIINIDERTGGSDLIDSVKMTKASNGELQFSHSIAEIAQALLDNKTVVLHGQLTEKAYLALESLFQPNPSLHFKNGQSNLKVPGKLIILSKPYAFNTTLANQTHKRAHIPDDYLWLQYAKQFKDHKGIRYLNKIQKIYAFLKDNIIHGQVGTPPAARINGLRLKNILDALVNQDEKGQDNLIKSFLLHDYDKNTENYAKANIKIKQTLSESKEGPAVRLHKLKHLPDTKEFFWRRLNCLNKAALDMLPAQTPEALNEYIAKGDFKPIIKNKDTQNKVKKRINHYLNGHNAVVLKGPPGTGKSYISRKCYESSSFFVGEAGIEKFLSMSQSDKKPTKDNPAVLLIDEANLSKPGLWDFLFPHLLKDKSGPSIINYKGQSYTLDNNFKIIFTCNPESDPGRDYHAILQDTPTVYMNAWTDETIKNEILLKMCPELSLSNQLILDKLLKIYHKVESLLPPQSLSLRDIQQLTKRWLFLMKKGLNSHDAAYHAAKSEWQYRFFNAEKSMEFLKTLDAEFPKREEEKPLKYKNEKPFSADFYLNSAQSKLFEQLQQDLLLFLDSTEEKTTIDYASTVKLGYVIEGPSGIGKSRLSYELLKSMDYTELKPTDLLTTKDIGDKAFIQFTLSGNLKQDEEILRAAFNKGCKVILDELNLDPAIESLLNDLLTGKTPEGLPPEKRGFFLLGSQNSSMLAGRSASPPALLNRLHVYYVHSYTAEQLLEMTQQALPDFSHMAQKNIVDAFLESKKKNPASINDRNFMQGLAYIKREGLFNPHKDFKQECTFDYGYVDKSLQDYFPSLSTDSQQRLTLLFNRFGISTNDPISIDPVTDALLNGRDWSDITDMMRLKKIKPEAIMIESKINLSQIAEAINHHEMVNLIDQQRKTFRSS